MNAISCLKGSAVSALAVLALTITAPADARGPQGPVPGKPGDQNIVELAIAVNDGGAGEFNYLLAAATCEYFDGAIVELLSGDEKYTLFAPTDAAFKGLLGADSEPGDACTLPQEVLFDVLAYHVTEGRRFSNSVFNRNAVKQIEMLNGQYVITNPGFTLTDIAGQAVSIVVDEDDAPVANINASNGVIHVIDTVLLPFVPAAE